MNGSSSPRTFDTDHLVRFSSEKALVTEICVTSTASIAVWGVKPGQRVPTHMHPDGQDTWIMPRGELTYRLGGGHNETIRAGQVDVAEPLQVHGAVNNGPADAMFPSIYSAPTLKVVPAAP
jgi:quercetin dioxygenase-like cupin family protein